jgi:ectoine hydroxylase-related dioxygenase (phytanoyl-CoA dioxygenase family)
MSKVDEILAKQKELEEQLKQAMEEEREVVLKDIKDKIRRFEFKATDFKGLLKSRVTKKQVEEFLAKKSTVVQKTSSPKKPSK